MIWGEHPPYLYSDGNQAAVLRRDSLGRPESGVVLDGFRVTGFSVCDHAQEVRLLEVSDVYHFPTCHPTVDIELSSRGVVSFLDKEGALAAQDALGSAKDLSIAALLSIVYQKMEERADD